MLRHNVFACAKDTREGLRRPRFPAAARSGRNPPPDPRKISSGTNEQARPPRGAVGTASLPVLAPYSSDRAGTVEAASSGRTVIRHGASGRETVPSFADHLKGQDALNEDSEAGDSPIYDDSPRPDPFTFVPDYRARKEATRSQGAFSVSSCDFSSNESGSRSLLARGPSSTPEDGGQRESPVVPVRGDRGASWRVMGMSDLFKRRPPTEITVPRRTEWRGVRQENLKSSDIGGEAEPTDPERPDQGKTESRENRIGFIPRPSLGTWNLNKGDVPGATSSAFVDDLPTELSSRTVDQPDELHAESQRDGGAESDEKHPRGSSRAPWATRKTPIETDAPRRRNTNYGALNADGSSSFELPKSEPIKNNAVGSKGENLESEQKAIAYPHLQNTGAWDSAAGSAAVGHEPETLEVGQLTSALAQVQHAKEGPDSSGGSVQLDTLTTIVDVESPAWKPVDTTSGFESESHHPSSPQDTNRSQEDSSEPPPAAWDSVASSAVVEAEEGRDSAAGSAHLHTQTTKVDVESPPPSSVGTSTFESESDHSNSPEGADRIQEDSSAPNELTAVESVHGLHAETGAIKKQESLVSDPIQSYSPRFPSAGASLDEVALPLGGTTRGIGVAGARDTEEAEPMYDGSRSMVSTGVSQETDENGGLIARPTPVATEIPSDRYYSNYTFEASPPPDGHGTGVKW